MAGLSERVRGGELSSDTDTIMAICRAAVIGLSSIGPLKCEISSMCSTVEFDIVTRLDSGMMWNWSDDFCPNCCVREKEEEGGSED